MYRGYLKASENNDLVAVKTGKGTYLKDVKVKLKKGTKFEC